MNLFFLLVLLLGLSSEPDNSPFCLGDPSSSLAADDSLVLLEKPTYSVLYSVRTNAAIFSAWHLSTLERGDVKRFVGLFQPDDSLPIGWPRIHDSAYTGTGYDRGHLCPSDDRTATIADNISTFCLSNVVPQAPGLNRKTWEHLEAWCRAQVDAGYECYIVAGTYGSQGKLNALVTIPAYCWKVVVLLPQGDNDLVRIDANTQVVAVWMPNDESAGELDWQSYRTSIRTIEGATGLNFLSNVASDIQDSLETRNP